MVAGDSTGTAHLSLREHRPCSCPSTCGTTCRKVIPRALTALSIRYRLSTWFSTRDWHTVLGLAPGQPGKADACKHPWRRRKMAFTVNVNVSWSTDLFHWGQAAAMASVSWENTVIGLGTDTVPRKLASPIDVKNISVRYGAKLCCWHFLTARPLMVAIACPVAQLKLALRYGRGKA